MAIHRAREGLLAATALVVAACATGIAPADDSLGQQENAPPPPSDVPTTAAHDASSNGEASTPDAGHPQPHGEAGTPQPDATPDTGPTTCTKTLTIPNVSLSNSVCTDINTKVTKAPATLTYPCAGGNASATFGAQAFAGTVTGTTIDVKNVESFTLKSCQLQSTQEITGDLAAAPLSYSYGEKFLGGDCSGFIICKATGKVSVQ
jgi:hypothetical protein